QTELTAQPSSLHSHCQVDVERVLGVQIRVADLIATSPLVDTIGEQLERRWSTEATTKVEHQGTGLGEPVRRSRVAGDCGPVPGSRHQVEVRHWIVVERAMIDSRTERQLQSPEVHLLETEIGRASCRERV